MFIDFVKNLLKCFYDMWDGELSILGEGNASAKGRKEGFPHKQHIHTRDMWENQSVQKDPIAENQNKNGIMC